MLELIERRGDNAMKKEAMEALQYATEYFTGVRSSGDLTVANLVAIQPTIDLQRRGSTTVFVADMHGATTRSVGEARRHNRDLVRAYIAMGLDPETTDIFVQSRLQSEVAMMTHALGRYVTMAELMRQPSLKEKVKTPEQAPIALAMYPVMMAADILLQDAHFVPVGADQMGHIELTRNIVARVNADAGTSTLFKPEAYREEEPPRYMSLRGEGKMSKSNPDGALLLTDTEDDIKRKIRKAETAFPGQTSPHLESHIALAKRMASQKDIGTISRLYEAHMTGERVMGEFKELFTHVTLEYLERFRNIGGLINDDILNEVLERGAHSAQMKAGQVIKRMRAAGVMF